MSSQNSYGTNWSEILDQVDKFHIPVPLVREIHFYRRGRLETCIKMCDLSPDTVIAFGKAMYEDCTDDIEIKLMFDFEMLKKVVSDVVEPMLAKFPRRL